MPAPMPESKHAVTAAAVQATIDLFTQLDQSGDKDAMNELAMRLGREQPALLQYAAQIKFQHGDALGEAAVFYATLVWSMFDRHLGKRLPRLVPGNLVEAQKIVEDERAAVAGLGEKPVHERWSASCASSWPRT